MTTLRSPSAVTRRASFGKPVSAFSLCVAFAISGVTGSSAQSAAEHESASPQEEVDLHAATDRAEEQQSAPGASEPGLTVYVDPETGQILERPLPEQREALLRARQQELRASDALRAQPADDPELREFRVGPLVGVVLDDRFMSALQIQVGPDGELHYRCGHEGGDHAHTSGSPPLHETAAPSGADQHPVR